MTLTSNKAPPINTGTKKYFIKCKGFAALLLADLDNRENTEYKFALPVTQEDQDPPVMIVAAERNLIDSSSPDDKPDNINTKSNSKYFCLGFYDMYGHIDFGQIENLDNIEVFKSKAIDVMKDYCKITGDVEVYEIDKLNKDVNDAHKQEELFTRLQQLHPLDDSDEMLSLLDEIQQIGVSNEQNERFNNIRKLVEDAANAKKSLKLDLNKLVNKPSPDNIRNDDSGKYSFNDYLIMTILTVIVFVIAFFVFKNNY